MEGLEATEISVSYVKSHSDILRFDSTFYRKKYLEDENLLLNSPHCRLSDISSNISSFGAYSLTNYISYQETGIPFIRGVNLKGGVVDFNNMLHIDETANKLLWKSKVTPRMILISMSGTIGDIAIAEEGWDYPINSNQDIAKIEISHEKYNSHLVYTFLRTKFGQNQITREGRGSVQQHIFLSQIEKLLIPILSDRYQSKIETLVIAAHKKLHDSNVLYKKAEETLLSALGLSNYTPTEKNISIKSLNSSFGESGRLDSEFYQPKYDEIKTFLLKQATTKPLSKMITQIQRGKQPQYSEEGLPVVNSKHVRTGRVILDNNRIGAIIEGQILIEKDDLLMNGTGVGTIGRVAPYLHVEKAIPDNHVTVIKTSGINPIYLSVFLNSIAGQLQVEKYQKGSSGQIELYPSEIKQFLVWVAPTTIQEYIHCCIEKSFTTESESKRLLDLAKKSVEIAIEESEEAAIRLIENIV